MEDKRGTKRSHSPSKEDSSSPCGGSTPLSALSRSRPPPWSPSDIFTRRPCSLVLEQGGPSEKVPLVDWSLSSDEEGLISYTSHDEEFTRRPFGDFNRDVLGPPDDSNIIILSNSDNEEEVHEEDAIVAKVVPSSIARSPAPATSIANADEDPKGMQDDNSDGLAPDRERGDGSSGGDKAVHLRLLHQGGTCREVCFKENCHGSALLLLNFSCAEEWRW
jgi:hypothetical protein